MLDLIKASERGDLDKVRSLIEAGADINAIDKDGNTALIWATAKGHLNVVNCLIEAKVDVNKKGKDGNTALILASRIDRLDIVECLVKAEAGVDAVDNGGRTALILASKIGHLDIVKYLIGAGADVNVKDKNGNTALTYATQNRYLGVKEYLEKRLEEIEIQEKNAKFQRENAKLQREKYFFYIACGSVMGLVLGINIACDPLVVAGSLLGAIVGYVIAKKSWKKGYAIGIGSVIGLVAGKGIKYYTGITSLGIYAVPAVGGLLLGAIAGYVIAGVKKDRDPIEKDFWKKSTLMSIGGAIGLAASIDIVCCAGTTAIEVYAVSAIVGLLLGAIVGYVIAAVKKEKDRDPSIGVASALKNVFCSSFKCSNSAKSESMILMLGN